MPLPAAKKMSVCPFTSPSEGDRKSTRLNSSHSQISYAVFFFKKKTRLNSSHSQISYAVFCLKKKKRTKQSSSLETGTMCRECAHTRAQPHRRRQYSRQRLESH